MAADPVWSYGVDAVNGGYFGAPIDAQVLAESVRTIADPAEETRAVRAKAAEKKPTLHPMADVDVDNLASAGWGIIFAKDCPAAIVDALEPLRAWRRAQAGSRYREFMGADGYHPGDTVRSFLNRHRMGLSFADPRRVPYYLLLVGGPADIPFAFQYRLDIQYAVGRLAFDEPALYKRYATSIVDQEQAAAAAARSEPRQAVVFAPSNDGDRATELSHRELAGSVTARCAEQPAARWRCERALGARATKGKLTELLCGNGSTSLLFTASHGICFPKGHSKQASDQGAILCQDWPGPGYRGEVPDEWYFGSRDLANARVKGLVAFLFACYSAGTPERDYFPEKAKVAVQDMATHDLIASLPQALLCHQDGSALAVIGHVDRAWTWSFWWPDAGAQTGAYTDFIDLVMAGRRVGYAMEQFGQRYAELGSELADLYDVLRSDRTQSPEPTHFSSLWTARNDARSFVVLGDPAVRIL